MKTLLLVAATILLATACESPADRERDAAIACFEASEAVQQSAPDAFDKLAECHRAQSKLP